MPGKTKEDEELKEKKNITKTKKSTTSKKTTSKSKNTTAKPKSKEPVTRKKATSKSKVASTKKSTTKKTTKAKKSTSNTKKSKKIESTTVEYYDLPQKYNQTVVKVLAQTPKTLFIYWEISDDDIAKYKKQYGENFFETTRPVLIVHNDTLNYSFEVEINDYANSWYLHINDSNSDYRIELGRRPISNNNNNNNNNNIKENYIYISSSNEIESPNDHILFNNSQKMVYYRNVKTNQDIKKPVSKLFFMKNMGKIYDIYDLYQELYKNEDNLENLSNPSSNTSSKFK